MWGDGFSLTQRPAWRTNSTVGKTKSGEVCIGTRLILLKTATRAQGPVKLGLYSQRLYNIFAGRVAGFSEACVVPAFWPFVLNGVTQAAQ